ncbi:MAG TPA: translation initiation factor 2, partial [Paracoccaceae bacterium]|nr:translation initiation factor 2 [Paracoccaceae bacterium]
PLPLATADAPPVAPVPPPPPGEVYQFDAEGRIVPTERGVVAPGGFWLIAARPDPLPPPRPADLVAAPPAAEGAASDAAADAAIAEATAAEPADAAAAEDAAEGGFQPDPAFAGSRPRPRPAGLVPPAPADAPVQAEDDASAAPPVDPRFASVRPRVRPESVVARAEEARRATEAASLAVAAAQGTAAAPQGWDPNASPLAVSMSRRPAPRPADLTGVVAAAAAVAVRPQDGPALDPEEEDEPEVAASAAPRIPTRASVAKQATFANAINLSRLNLIGIYGTPSKRSALVRSSSGRYTKVEVGDRLDGGRVAAITASELRYEKGGRMLVLEMPRG